MQRPIKTLALAMAIGFRLFNGVAEEGHPTLAELKARLDEHVSDPRFASALWGIKVVSLDTGSTIFERNPHKLLSPASNSKLYSVAVALDRLGPDYRITTSLYAAALPRKSGVLKGDLIVFGRGDPTFSARLVGGDIFRALEPLVAALTNAGVKRITGDLIGDESYFRGPPFGSGWAWDDLENYYGAEISALTINDNSLQVVVKPGPSNGAPCQVSLSPPSTWLTFSNRTTTAERNARRTLNLYRPIDGNVVYVTGQMPIGAPDYEENIGLHNPAGLFVTWFREALAHHGIKVGGRTRTLNWLDRQAHPFPWEKMVEIGSVASPRLGDIAREILKPSQNLYTDMVLAHVGEQARLPDTSPDRTSEDLGVLELNRFLRAAGVPDGEVLFEEGSGLSRNNLTTPAATVALLQFMSRHQAGEDYLNALPIAGVDGTLRNRMKGTPAAGNVRAKTGTLRWAHSLSGHVKTAAGERLLFSIMLNRYHSREPDHSGRAELDVIPVLLASLAEKSE